MRQPHKMVKHTHAIRRLLPTNCWSVFDHFVGLALKWLSTFSACESQNELIEEIYNLCFH